MDKHVYCTNCVTGDALIKNISENKKIPYICNGCYPWDLEDSRSISLRKMYKEKEKIGMSEEPLIFEYKNWKGKISVRRVVPDMIIYGNTEYHKENQWLMFAKDIDKNAMRTFAMKDIIRFF